MAITGKNWLNSLTEGAESVDEDKDEEEDFDVDMPPPPPKIQTYKQAVVSLEDIKIFLEHHGRLELASNATSLLSELVTCHAATLSQTTLHQFFD